MEHNYSHLCRKLAMVMALMCFLVLPAFAQKITVHGTVYDELGEELIGATVKEKGTTNGVATDLDGRFSINIDPNATLVVSYVGYDPQEIPVNGRTEITVHMSENATMLAETVVIGYGSVKKSDATGSVAVITPDDIEAGIATSTQDLLVGASPGVVVTLDGGSPTGNGTIRIRGGSSLSANNNPLIVIDGVPMTDQSSFGGTNALTMINPQNIESMTVLKDASATAIYGSRASNGVIIVTTKKGKSGKPQVNFAANWHVNTARNMLKLMNGDEYREAVTEMLGTQSAISQLGDANTNWQKEVLRTTFSQDYSLSVGGAAGFLPYRVNASFTDNQGILKTSGMQRTTVGFNLSPKFFDDKLSINANVNGTYIDAREADWGAIGAASGYNPTLPVYTHYQTTSGMNMWNGFTNYLPGGTFDLNSAINPLQLLLDVNNKSKVYSSNGNIQFDYALHFLPELHFNLNLGYQVSKNEQTSITAANSMQAWRNGDLDQMGVSGAGTKFDRYELQRNTLLDFYVNYKKDLEAIKSNLDVMLGYSWQKFDYKGHSQSYINSLGYMTSAGVSGFAYDEATGIYDVQQQPNDPEHNKVGAVVNDAPMDRWANPLQLVSFFGRLNYIYDDTYLLTFTLRDDATSRFSKDNRWGLFPSVALGWKFINNSFMEQTRGWWNEGKLRLGWGITGQQDIGSYFPYMPVYTVSDKAGFQYIGPNGQWINPIYPQAYDSNIKWEETTTWNVGLDLGFMNNRVTFNFDWYLRDTKDLLAYTPVAGVNTANYMTRNIGSLRNMGIEGTVTARPVDTEYVTWNTSLNVAWNKNKITKLTGDAETSRIEARDLPGGTGGALQYHLVGQPAFTYMVYQQVYDENGDPIPNQYVDQNADGIINDEDRIMYHSPEPKVTLTWNNTVSYKNWDFGITLRANFGNYVYNTPRYDRTRLNSVDSYGMNNLLRDEFLFPTYTDNQNLIKSDYFVENASFIRCDNITVGYTFPHLLNDNLRLRLFGAVQNPFVITKYKGLDPEVFSGIDNNCYPRPITCTLGLVATF